MNEIREAILEAADEVGEEVEETAAPEETAAAAPEETAAVEATAPDAIEPETAETDSDNSPPDTVASADSTTATSDKPPVGWSPETREHWASLDGTVKKQIQKREADMETFMRDSAGDRRLAGDFNQAVAPYHAMMQAEGANHPLEAVTGLLKTAATLSMGSQQQKAERISQLIQHYGIDIETLDTVLSGNQPAAPQDDAMQQAINARLAPMEQMFQGMQQQQQNNMQNQNNKLNDDIGKFGEKAEFFADVRLDMADLMDFATQRGQDMSLQQAYDKACSLHPSISKVVASRKEQNDLGIKKDASGSLINGKLGGTAGNNLDGNLRNTLETLWGGGDVM